jgi:glycosyltransferase involved in cell wall biosynthesis
MRDASTQHDGEPMARTLTTARSVQRRLVEASARRRRARTGVCVIGPGKAFLSGMTYHTFGLVEALAAHGPVQAVLLRCLVPRHLYPGRDRVGADLSHLRLPPEVRRADRVDWWWGPGMASALWMVLVHPPAVVVVQWWSAAVWHTQLALVLAARIRGARIVIEVHEVMDTAEARHPLAGVWARWIGPALLAQADRIVVHSRSDQAAVVSQLHVRRSATTIIGEPPFDSYHLAPVADPAGRREGRPTELLFFGTIRPYKGVEDLVVAFDQLVDEDGPDAWRLRIVGEPWEGWTAHEERLARSPHRSLISYDARYVPDEDVDRCFSDADLVVLPYHRSATSGPLMVAMSYGLPVVVTSVGGLPEAVDGYGGAVVVDPRDPERLAEGIRKAERLVGQRHVAQRSWADVAVEHEALYRALGVEGRR